MLYSYPGSTPWDDMDRLELYYSDPSSQQPRGDYVRLRNMFVRSTRSFYRAAGADSSLKNGPLSRQRCSALDIAEKLRHVQGEGATRRAAASSTGVRERRAAEMRERNTRGRIGAHASADSGAADVAGDVGASNPRHDLISRKSHTPRRSTWVRSVRKLLPGVQAVAIAMVALLGCVRVGWLRLPRPSWWPPSQPGTPTRSE